MDIFVFITNSNKLSRLDYCENLHELLADFCAQTPFVLLSADRSKIVESLDSSGLENSKALMVHDEWIDGGGNPSSLASIIPSSFTKVYVIHHNTNGLQGARILRDCLGNGRCQLFEGRHESVPIKGQPSPLPDIQAYCYAVDLLFAEDNNSFDSILEKLRKHVSGDPYLEAALNFLHAKNKGDSNGATKSFSQVEKLAKSKEVKLNGLTADSDLTLLRDTLLSPY